jgi:hypothetical protein
MDVFLRDNKIESDAGLKMVSRHLECEYVVNCVVAILFEPVGM